MIGLDTMLPIRVSWDRFIDQNRALLEAAHDGVELLLRYLPKQPTISYIGSSWGEGDWGSTDWYLDVATIPGNRRQVDVTVVNNLLLQEPWQIEPHLDLLLTGRDLTTVGYNFLYGQAMGNTNVQSVAQFFVEGFPRELVGPTFRHVVFHELGHSFGLTPAGWPNSDQRKEPIYQGHCFSKGCAMNQFIDLGELLGYVVKREGLKFPTLCAYCQDYLARHWG